MVASLPHIAPHSRRYVARRLLSGLFPTPLPDPLPPYTDLGRPQQQLLHVIADLEEGHWNVADFGQRLNPHGLPDTQQALRAYLGLPPLPARCGCGRAQV
ncbi:hypothetical protein ASE09_20680 [Streptomyces sp. Root66D1]|nr:hypothetical protein ASD33_16160 [Streptomyces sp. Root1304]KRA78929.1 hypothetical protein ASE09_20680 [Streptomyces sp. Root66D1]